MNEEAIPLLSSGEENGTRGREHPRRNWNILLVVSLLVNALVLSAIMTEEMERSAEHLVASKATTNQLRAVTAKHANPPSMRSGAPSAALEGRLPHDLSPPDNDSDKKQQKDRESVNTQNTEKGKTEKFNLAEYREALIKRRQARRAGNKPPLPLHPAFRLRGADTVTNPNVGPQRVVDSRGAFFDPSLGALVDASILSTRASSRAQYAQLLEAEHKAAAAFLPQLGTLTTTDQGHVVVVNENEAQQLAHGIFSWGYENPDTGDIRLDCTDTLANAGSNGGAMNRFWGGKTKVDACGPRDKCEDDCAYKVWRMPVTCSTMPSTLAGFT